MISWKYKKCDKHCSKQADKEADKWFRGRNAMLMKTGKQADKEADKLCCLVQEFNILPFGILRKQADKEADNGETTVL